MEKKVKPMKNPVPLVVIYKRFLMRILSFLFIWGCFVLLNTEYNLLCFKYSI